MTAFEHTRRVKEHALEHTKYVRAGLAAVVLGAGAALVGALFAHFTGLPLEDSIGQAIYPDIPRGWVWELIGQTISLTGTLLLLGGLALAFLYRRELTWARASLGALLFVSLMMILFAVIPNQWLTLTQSVWEWTPQKIAFTVPPALVLNNEVSISYAAIKDIVSGTYSAVVIAAVAVAMYQWQERAKKATEPKPQPVSDFGRPMRVE